MSRTKTLVTALLLAPVVLVGLVTYYIRGEARQLVEQTVAALAPFAEIRHSGVSVTLGGDVRVHGIDIRPRIVNDSVRIEAINVETPGLWYLLTGTDELREGKLPANARIELRGVEVGLSGAIADALDRFLAMAVQTGGTAPMSNCGDVGYLDIKTHRRLGYANFVFDIGAGYRLDSRRGPLIVQAEWRTRDLATASVELEFSGAALKVNEMLASDPRLRRFSLRYQDLSFTDRLKLFCAQAAGITPEQYLEREFDRSDATWQAQWGFVPGSGLRAAYRDFLQRPGEIVIEGTPPNEIDLQAMRLFKPQDVAAMLNLRVNVNGKPVNDLSMTVMDDENVAAAPTPAPVTAPRATPMPVEKPAPATAKPAPTPAPTTTDGYRTITARELGAHIGATVRLRLVRGVVREGSLLQVTAGTARVERRYQGGSMTLVIPLNEITHAEVLAP